MAATLHPFERAHLGLAPFRCTGMSHRVGPIDMGGGVSVGAPGQPMGTCDYCGTGIADCYQIVSSDGKRFIVGSDCVTRTYQEVGTDVPLSVRRAIADAARAKREAARPAKEARLAARVLAAKAILDADETLFADRPHWNSWHASQGKTYRDYLLFCLKSGGAAGRTAACKDIERRVAPGHAVANG